MSTGEMIFSNLKSFIGFFGLAFLMAGWLALGLNVYNTWPEVLPPTPGKHFTGRLGQ